MNLQRGNFKHIFYVIHFFTLYILTIFINRIASGRSKFSGNKNDCKIVTVLLGDNPYCTKEIEMVIYSIV